MKFLLAILCIITTPIFANEGALDRLQHKIEKADHLLEQRRYLEAFSKYGSVIRNVLPEGASLEKAYFLPPDLMDIYCDALYGRLYCQRKLKLTPKYDSDLLEILGQIDGWKQ